MSTLLAYNLRQAGYEVICESSGGAGLQAALRYSIDLALIDIMLPELDGLSVGRELARQRPDLPVILLTALADKHTKLQGFEAGAEDYVTKPFDMDELLARIAVRLRKRPLAAPSGTLKGPLDSSGISLDRDTHSLRANDREVHLRAKEFDLLGLLLSQPGHLFTREEIVQAVWHQKYEPVTRSLDVHIRRLRVRLDEVGSPAAIESVRGVGYRIVIKE